MNSRDSSELFNAINNNDIQQIKACLEKGDSLDAVSRSLNTPLHVAAYTSAKIVDLLLKQGANPNAVNGNGETPLHIAAKGSCPSGYECAEAVYLLVRGGANVNAKNNEGNTPLHVCAKHSEADYSDSFSELHNFNHDIARFLLANGAQKEARNHFGVMPASLAHESGVAAILRIPSVSQESYRAVSRENEVLRAELSEMRAQFQQLMAQQRVLLAQVLPDVSNTPSTASLKGLGLFAHETASMSDRKGSLGVEAKNADRPKMN